MEDLRNNSAEITKSRFIVSNIINFFKKRWIKIIVLFLILFVILFPSLIGGLIGSWWNEFALSFIDKITYIK